MKRVSSLCWSVLVVAQLANSQSAAPSVPKGNTAISIAQMSVRAKFKPDRVLVADRVIWKEASNGPRNGTSGPLFAGTLELTRPYNGRGPGRYNIALVSDNKGRWTAVAETKGALETIGPVEVLDKDKDGGGTNPCGKGQCLRDYDWTLKIFGLEIHLKGTRCVPCASEAL